MISNNGVLTLHLMTDSHTRISNYQFNFHIPISNLISCTVSGHNCLSPRGFSCLFQIKPQCFQKCISWSWSYGSWIYKYLCNPCLSPSTLGVWIPLGRGVSDTIWCDNVCQWLVRGWWFSLGTPVSCTNKIDRHDVAEILVKVALNTITLTLKRYTEVMCWPSLLKFTFTKANKF